MICKLQCLALLLLKLKKGMPELLLTTITHKQNSWDKKLNSKKLPSHLILSGKTDN